MSTGTGIPIEPRRRCAPTSPQLHGCDPEQVFVANGSNEVLQTVLLAYAGPGRTVATFEPTYQMHAQIARVTGATVVEGERADDFTLDPAEVDRVLAEAAPHVVFLTSPNNPTGLVEPPERVEQLLASAPGLVVVDEAYAQFADWSALDMVDESRPLVVTRTFSKTWSMAGARLGYLVGPTWLVAELDKVVLPYHLDVVKQLAGRVALRYADDMNERVAILVAERTRITEALRALPTDVFDSGANFVLFRPTAAGGRAVWQALVDRSVLVRDCSSWPRLDNCLRVTVGTPEENDRFLAALTEILTDAERRLDTVILTPPTLRKPDHDAYRLPHPLDEGDLDRHLDRPRRNRRHRHLDRASRSTTTCSTSSVVTEGST